MSADKFKTLHMYCGLQSTGNFTVQNLEDHLLSKFWKLCVLLFGLVQHKCCNCSQRKDRTVDPHQVFLEHQHVEHQHLFSWVSVQHWSDQKVSPIKSLILSFCKPILFIRHEWGRVVKYFTIQNVVVVSSLSMGAAVLQCKLCV